MSNATFEHHSDLSARPLCGTRRGEGATAWPTVLVGEMGAGVRICKIMCVYVYIYILYTHVYSIMHHEGLNHQTNYEQFM